MIETYGISVKDYGATGDGVTDDAQALQRALDAGSPRVVVPHGTYLIKQGMQIRSNTHLTCHPNAHFRFADGAGLGPNDFLLTNSDHSDGNQKISIDGGIWDGNNPGNPRGPDQPDSYTGVTLNFTNVKGLTLRATRLLDSESYFVRLGKVSDFLIEDIDFEIRNLRPNQDGIHVTGHCADGIIRRIQGLGSLTPNDDLVALVADDALHRAQNLNGAFNGSISRIRVEHLRAHSCHSFIRLLSVDHPIADIEINDVVGGCRCCAINMDACRECRVTLFDEADRPQGVGSISNVRVADMTVHKASDTSHQPLIDFRTRADNFNIERFRRNTDLDVSPQTPTLCIEQSGALHLALEGLAEPQPEGVELIETVAGVSSYRLEQELESDTQFTLQSGDIQRLKVKRR